MGCVVMLAIPLALLLLVGMCAGDSEAEKACRSRGIRWHMDDGEWPRRPDGELTEAYVHRECERSTRAYPEE